MTDGLNSESFKTDDAENVNDKKMQNDLVTQSKLNDPELILLIKFLMIHELI